MYIAHINTCVVGLTGSCLFKFSLIDRCNTGFLICDQVIVLVSTVIHRIAQRHCFVFFCILVSKSTSHAAYLNIVILHQPRVIGKRFAGIDLRCLVTVIHLVLCFQAVDSQRFRTDGCRAVFLICDQVIVLVSTGIHRIAQRHCFVFFCILVSKSTSHAAYLNIVILHQPRVIGKRFAGIDLRCWRAVIHLVVCFQTVDNQFFRLDIGSSELLSSRRVVFFGVAVEFDLTQIHTFSTGSVFINELAGHSFQTHIVASHNTGRVCQCLTGIELYCFGAVIDFVLGCNTIDQQRFGRDDCQVGFDSIKVQAVVISEIRATA